MNILTDILKAVWEILLDSSAYILFGILVAGFLRVFLNPAAVARHLGQGTFMSVFKSALFGMPFPLCSCGVVPAAVSLRRQGANRGATTAFLIATPETGMDSIALSYALLDPIMTAARPLAAVATACVAGAAQNLTAEEKDKSVVPDLTCPVDGCCDGLHCPPEVHRAHHSFGEKLRAGLRFAFVDLWSDIVLAFVVGLFLAACISVLVPAELMYRYLGGGLVAMLVMLGIGIPTYICATASTPIAAALVLKGVSPGAALVFLLAGPATNMASLAVIVGLLGKGGTALYLGILAVCSILFGLVLDGVYGLFGLPSTAMIGQAAELVPGWAQVAGAILLVVFSMKPLFGRLRCALQPGPQRLPCGCVDESCGPIRLSREKGGDNDEERRKHGMP
jgi:hypothetical protein